MVLTIKTGNFSWALCVTDVSESIVFFESKNSFSEFTSWYMI